MRGLLLLLVLLVVFHWEAQAVLGGLGAWKGGKRAASSSISKKVEEDDDEDEDDDEEDDVVVLPKKLPQVKISSTSSKVVAPTQDKKQQQQQRPSTSIQQKLHRLLPKVLPHEDKSYLVEFHSDNCDHCEQMEPVLQRLERDLQTKVRRINIFRRREFYGVLEAMGHDECGGLPFYYNRRTGQAVCGATGYLNLKRWGTGDLNALFQDPPENMHEQEPDHAAARKRDVGLKGFLTEKMMSLDKKGGGEGSKSKSSSSSSSSKKNNKRKQTVSNNKASAAVSSSKATSPVAKSTSVSTKDKENKDGKGQKAQTQAATTQSAAAARIAARRAARDAKKTLQDK